jgi:hypothetical protein
MDGEDGTSGVLGNEGTSLTLSAVSSEDSAADCGAKSGASSLVLLALVDSSKFVASLFVALPSVFVELWVSEIKAIPESPDFVDLLVGLSNPKIFLEPTKKGDVGSISRRSGGFETSCSEIKSALVSMVLLKIVSLGVRGDMPIGPLMVVLVAVVLEKSDETDFERWRYGLAVSVESTTFTLALNEFKECKSSVSLAEKVFVDFSKLEGSWL